MENKLVSRTAVVTGAAQGIGAAIARLFVQQDRACERQFLPILLNKSSTNDQPV
ncbi:MULTISPECIES: hypothetical protein [unclassified Pseudomonas syringae group]|uniref:hypothetical protein n=1 Tax=unclassified Pseudomonas syringae group TaxID=2775504 RepID=UPI00290D4BC3|nr:MULTISPECIES: hypothetical protein [unclassified Pseudomonas syringae group]MDU8607539.1 hypothetical protein [Pseudomonas syringae group sp. 247E2]MDU8631826.1 hypothetical protein [Pseudomonas syringae group sp. 243L2]MDU8647548.1 hypothetical protein [Pseudomonas syringae group sp. 26L6]